MRPYYTLVLLALLLISRLGHAAPATESTKPLPQNLGGYNCEAVKKSAFGDLRAFCEGEPYNKKRLVDFGYQIDILEVGCQLKEEATDLVRALNAKVHQRDERACLEIADKHTAK